VTTYSKTDVRYTRGPKLMRSWY